jgi:alcohol dehydrogenase (cytochrome c)
VPRLQRLAAQNPQTPGSVSTGVVARNSIVKPGEVVGSFAALNPATGEKKWEVPLVEMPSAAGMLATDNGLVFTGKLSGEFVALDADTGATLWQFKTGSSVNSTAITYTHHGRQFPDHPGIVALVGERGCRSALCCAAEPSWIRQSRTAHD